MKTAHINIKEPIWSKKAVGISKKAIKDTYEVEVTIDYEYKKQPDEEKPIKPYPHTYRLKTFIVESFPIKKVKNNTELYIVPIKAFEAIK